MGLTGEKKKQYQRDYMRKKRATISPYITAEPKSVGLIYPDILDKLTNPFWRSRLEKICASFKSSRYASDVWLGDTNLGTVCDWLECTS